MKSNNEYLEEVFQKYQEVKNNKDKNSFYKKKIQQNIAKTAAVIILSLCSTIGIAYAGFITYEKIWKAPEKYNFFKEQEITEKDIAKSITEEEAIEKAKEITESLGKKFGNVKKAELTKNVSTGLLDWYIVTDNQINITINSETGKLKQIADWSIDDTKIPSTVSKSEAESIAKELYFKLGYKEGEYEIAKLSQNGVSDDTNLWQVNFCKKYDGVYNYYQNIRMTFIPEVKQLTILTIFDYDYEDNPIVIAKEDAIKTAKNKALELGREEDKIKSITTTLDIKKMNAYVYSQEQNKDKTFEDISMYRTEEIVRKVWVVEIEYYSEFAAIDFYYIDVTTGEIIGGDSTG